MLCPQRPLAVTRAGGSTKLDCKSGDCTRRLKHLRSPNEQTISPRSKKPSEVFTPRAAQVNDAMYVHRPKLEERLIDAIDSSKYIVIHGESGNGKTWLYKRVFSAQGIHYDIINLAQVVVTGSLDAAFREKLGDIGYSQLTVQETNTTVGFKPIADHAMKTTQIFPAKSAFIALLERIKFRADGKKAVLVLDNFESIMGDENALKQLGALIISADEEAVAKHEVQVVIVGVPGNLKETITRLNNAGPIANRLTELSEVARMADDEATDLIKRGFQQLNLSVDPAVEDDLFGEISWRTDRIAQHIHELCLIVAQNAVRNGGVIDQAVVDKSTSTWIDDSLSSDLAVIESAMNAREPEQAGKIKFCTLWDNARPRTSNIVTLRRWSVRSLQLDRRL